MEDDPAAEPPSQESDARTEEQVAESFLAAFDENKARRRQEDEDAAWKRALALYTDKKSKVERELRSKRDEVRKRAEAARLALERQVEKPLVRGRALRTRRTAVSLAVAALVLPISGEGAELFGLPIAHPAGAAGLALVASLVGFGSQLLDNWNESRREHAIDVRAVRNASEHASRVVKNAEQWIPPKASDRNYDAVRNEGVIARAYEEEAKLWFNSMELCAERIEKAYPNDEVQHNRSLLANRFRWVTDLIGPVVLFVLAVVRVRFDMIEAADAVLRGICSGS